MRGPSSMAADRSLRAAPIEEGSSLARCLAARARLDVTGVAVVAGLLVIADCVSLWLRAPSFDPQPGMVLFLPIVWSLALLVLGVPIVARGLLRAWVVPRGASWRVAVGAFDGVIAWTLVITLTRPTVPDPSVRPWLLVLVLVLGATSSWVLFDRDGNVRARIATPIAWTTVVLAAGGLQLLSWSAYPYLRIGLHLALVLAIAHLVRSAVSRMARTALPVVAGLAAAATMLASGPTLRTSAGARRLLHGRSAVARAWSMPLTELLDADGDEAATVLGGRDCDDHDDGRSPGAAEVPGNGRDDNCRAGDGRARVVGRAATVATGDARRRDLVLLSFDSVRWDATAELRAALRRLGPHAELSRAFAPSTRTIFSLGSVLRGRPLRQLRFDQVAATRGAVLWRDPTATLGHVLSAAGYRAITVPTHAYVEPRTGVFSGFEAVYASNYDRRLLAAPFWSHASSRVPAAHALAVAMAVARDTPAPLAIAIHLMDTATPADLPALRRTAGIEGRRVAAWLAQLARTRGAPPLVAIHSDHGEELGEHGGRGHGSSVHAELVRVPLYLIGPGVSPGRYDAPVSTSSLAPTLLDLLQLATPSTMTAPSLLGPMNGTAPWPSIAVSEARPAGRVLVGYSSERYRLLVDPVHDVDWLFDSVSDPYERTDLSQRRPDVLRSMRRLAEAWDETH